MSETYRVYWQPGCSSCLRTKEFLIDQGIHFESINVVESPGAMSDLAALGFRSVPVVARGELGTYCQDLRDVADFVGVSLAGPQLTAEQYVEKCQRIIAAAQRFACQLSGQQLREHFPGRDRPYSDLVYHIFMVVQAFVAAAEGGTLEYEWFERVTPEGLSDGPTLAHTGEQVKTGLQNWWRRMDRGLPAEMDTYYGRRDALGVLERTTWHAAHHCRQLQAVLEMHGVTPDGPLGDAELAGLPLPEGVYDNEIRMQPDPN
ncbi:MAG: glutaredoxin domain-containing protein [Xanthomonadales bacterium]|nr:glutaredoxin domain-containing protein [Xanthomonadales bacterium]